jgi:hypothetical protein
MHILGTETKHTSYLKHSRLQIIRARETAEIVGLVGSLFYDVFFQ